MYMYRRLGINVAATDAPGSSTTFFAPVGIPSVFVFPHVVRLHKYELDIGFFSGAAIGAATVQIALAWVNSGTVGGLIDIIESDECYFRPMAAGDWQPFSFSHDYGEVGKELYSPRGPAIGVAGIGLIARTGAPPTTSEAQIRLLYSLDVDYRSLPPQIPNVGP